MKIEKVNDNQIRCTLTKADLADRQLKLSELAYGTEKAKDLFRDMMQQANLKFGFEAEDIPLMIGVLEVLNMLEKNQIKQYVLSASDKKMVFDQMSVYGIRELFEDVIAPQDGYALGKIELAKQWMSEQNISASNIVMIGDTLHDFETAEAIGIDCALIDMGHQDLKAFMHDSNIIVYDNIDKLAEDVFSFQD